MNNGEQIIYASKSVATKMNSAGSKIGSLLFRTKQPYLEVERLKREYLLYLKLKKKFER